MSSARENTVLKLHQLFNRHQMSLDSQETAFSKMLFATTCRHACSLQTLIASFVHKKIPAKYQQAETILLTATAEILFMDSPDYAVINEYVNIAKKHHLTPLSGFINAVLRNIIRQKETLLKNYRQIFFPPSFKEILSLDYTPQTISDIERVSCTQPPLNITVKQDSSSWAQTLHGTAIDSQSLALSASGKIETLAGYKEGLWWVQDYAASLAVKQFSNLKNKRVLDLCAAPGGKTAQLISAGAKVTSLDSSRQRLETLAQNMDRLHFEPEKIICADALRYLSEFQDEPFDAILLDAPCSATGVFRRHPEIVHLKTPEDIKTQATLQYQILQNIPSALKNGGELVYCTCSIAKQEGEQQITRFISEHPQFKIIPLQNSKEPNIITPEGFIRTLPFHFADIGGCDSFFIAKLRKELSDGQ